MEKNGWKTVAKTNVKNKQLCQELDRICSRYSITWWWVKGHSGHPENENADQLANQAIKGKINQNG